MTPRLDAGAVAPDAMKALAGVHAYLAKSGLPIATPDLVFLRASRINIGQTQDDSDEDFATAKVVFEDKELADLTVATGLMNAYDRLGVGLRLTRSAATNAG